MEKETKVEVKKIKFKVGDNNLELSLNEAKKLHEVLGELFGKQIVQEHHHHYDRWWYNPYPNVIYCSGQTVPTDKICLSENSNVSTIAVANTPNCGGAYTNTATDLSHPNNSLFTLTGNCNDTLELNVQI